MLIALWLALAIAITWFIGCAAKLGGSHAAHDPVLRNQHCFSDWMLNLFLHH